MTIRRSGINFLLTCYSLIYYFLFEGRLKIEKYINFIQNDKMLVFLTDTASS